MYWRNFCVRDGTHVHFSFRFQDPTWYRPMQILCTLPQSLSSCVPRAWGFRGLVLWVSSIPSGFHFFSFLWVTGAWRGEIWLSPIWDWAFRGLSLSLHNVPSAAGGWLGNALIYAYSRMSSGGISLLPFWDFTLHPWAIQSQSLVLGPPGSVLYGFHLMEWVWREKETRRQS